MRDDEIAIAVGAELRRLRMAAGLPRKEVASRVATSCPALSRMEHGWNTPSFEVCVRITSACGGTMRSVGAAIDQVIKRRVAASRVSAARRPHASRWSGPFTPNCS
jgi:transcriptional regulator with XRE-family HTH domain